MGNHTKSFKDYFDYFNHEVDFRLRDKVLMSSPILMFLICACYFVATHWFKNFMIRNSKYVINTKPLIVIYFICVLIKTIELFWRLVRYMIWAEYDFRCMAVDMSTEPEVMDVRKKS